ncbi:MAG: c-type cytochrome [Gammaproteobacteria bacterium]
MAEADHGPPDDARKRRWRLSAMWAELQDNLSDLGVHLWTHWRLILGMAAAILLGAGLFAWSGVYSVAATSGHYMFFRTFLSFALRQSVNTHTIGLTAPPLADPAMVRRGAGHYQGGCAPCHGAPGQDRNPITRRMLPEPPYLPPVVETWTAEKLFWIVRHGIKYAGMPAWVAPERADEVWSVVAFLQRLPGMDIPTYRRLAFGDVTAASAGAREGLDILLVNGPAGQGIAACGRCHGIEGAIDESGAFPRLNGLSEAYLLSALQSYALGTRPSGIMQPVAAELDPAEMRLLAAHYASQVSDGPAANAVADPAVLERGARIALQGLPERSIAACAACHGPNAAPPNPLYPSLSGQNPRYIAAQLELWMTGVRGNQRDGPLSRVMARAVGVRPDQAPPPREALWPLSRDDIAAVAAWYAARSSASGGGVSP